MQRINRSAVAEWVRTLVLCHLAGLAIFIAPRAVSADEPVSDAKKQAIKNLRRGEWVVEWTLDDVGTRLPGDGRRKIVFNDDYYTWTLPAQHPIGTDFNEEIKHLYELNVSKEPWVMRVTPLGGDPMTYIIRITGDKLELCQGERGVAPTVFDAAKGSGRYLTILKRSKPTRSIQSINAPPSLYAFPEGSIHCVKGDYLLVQPKLDSFKVFIVEDVVLLNRLVPQLDTKPNILIEQKDHSEVHLLLKALGGEFPSSEKAIAVIRGVKPVPSVQETLCQPLKEFLKAKVKVYRFSEGEIKPVED